MIVQQDARNRINENLEFLLVRNLIQKRGVQSVNAFDQQDASLAERKSLAIILANTCNEVVFRDLYFLSIN